jgi:hypothetical protein
VKPHAALLAGLAAVALFAVGLVSPLTPSEGCPSATHIGGFAALPAVAPLITLLLVRHPGVKAALAAESAAIGLAAVWLLHGIGCLP